LSTPCFIDSKILSVALDKHEFLPDTNIHELTSGHNENPLTEVNNHENIMPNNIKNVLHSQEFVRKCSNDGDIVDHEDISHVTRIEISIHEIFKSRTVSL
jgi:hypothetical protein